MPSYGIRFYKVELFNGNKQTPLSFIEEDGGKSWRYGEHLATVLERFKENQVRGFPRSQTPDGESVDQIRKKTAMVFNAVDRRGPNTVVAEYRVGRSDDFDRAYPAPDLETSDYLELNGYAPARPYRAVLMVPPEGEVGMLAVEAIGRTCPYEFFTKWATKWSRDYQAELDSSDPLDDDKVRAWWRLKPTPLGSKSQLVDFIKGGTIEELILINHYIDKTRNERQERFRVKAKVRTGQRPWAKKRLNEVFEVDSDEVFARQLAENFGNSVEHLDIDDGYVVVRTEAGVKNISPSRMPEVFTYPVSDDRPTMEEFLTAVKRHAIPLAKVIDAQVDFDSW
ncbi:hypothetical protein SEA_PCORAL7_42 [Gordonia phage PCoral7]|uniref:Uncharacterized protein n=1 Tax=Gordonia phage Toast TaxID=2599852 RepID=A0A5J6TGY9_9CAUD|nr:hypothetical protein JZX81_gp42 [Gordonia phage Toast]QFG08102.1 hypothetical protein PBI_TOAST_42 [Gordonia phage Toast]UVF60550.1 hypothetical protein SEA_PCORAL7_42 [Gordonia phage PCoral7]